MEKYLHFCRYSPVKACFGQEKMHFCRYLRGLTALCVGDAADDERRRVRLERALIMSVGVHLERALMVSVDACVWNAR